MKSRRRLITLVLCLAGGWLPSPASASPFAGASPAPSAIPTAAPIYPSPSPSATLAPPASPAPTVPLPLVTSSLAPAPPPTKPGSAKESNPPTAVIARSSGSSLTAQSSKGRFDLVALQKSETVDVVIQYSTAKAGRSITVIALDGGQVIATDKTIVVGKDGAIRFRFQAGKETGLYQLGLREGADETGLQFWVMDDDPRRNPISLAREEK